MFIILLIILYLDLFSFSGHRLLPLSHCNSKTLLCFPQERTAAVGTPGMI